MADTMTSQSIYLSSWDTLSIYIYIQEPRWHSGSDAVLQIGRSRVRSQLVSLEFFIDIILQIA